MLPTQREKGIRRQDRETALAGEWEANPSKEESQQAKGRGKGTHTILELNQESEQKANVNASERGSSAYVRTEAAQS